MISDQSIKSRIKDQKCISLIKIKIINIVYALHYIDIIHTTVNHVSFHQFNSSLRKKSIQLFKTF